MEKNILQYKCYLHQKEVQAFDLDPLADIQDKYLCLKCLAIQSPNRQIETIQDAQQKFMEMKILELKEKEKQLRANLEKLSIIQKIQEEQNELNNLFKSQQEIKTEKDLLDLTNYVNYGIINNYQMYPKQLEVINQIQKLLDYQIFEEHLQNISHSLESIQTKSQIEEQLNFISSEDLQVDQKKFISLRYLCEIHKSNIMMISFQPEQIEQRSFCCQICIQEKKSDGLISLYEVNKKWQIYSQNIYTSNIILHNNRQNTQSLINELISKYKKFHYEFFKGLSKLLINQNNKIITEKNELQGLSLHKQLFQMELQEIKQIVQKLQQRDQSQEILWKQYQVQEEDQDYYGKISEQFNQLQKRFLETQQEISKIFCMTDQIVGQKKLNERNKMNLSTQKLHINWMYKMKFSQKNLSINQINIYQIQLNKPEKWSQEFNPNIFTLFQEEPIDQHYQKNQYPDYQQHYQQPCKQSYQQPYQQPYQKQLQINQSQNNIFATNATKQIKKSIEILNNQLIVTKLDSHFSDILKHSSITLYENNKIAQIQMQSRLHIVCLCDKLIPVKGSFSVDFKIKYEKKFNQGHGDIMIGICKKKAINQNFIFDNKTNIGYGFYVQDCFGFIFSHHYSIKNLKNLGFEFQSNDIIKIQVNWSTKQIIWSNNDKGLSFALEFQPSEDLYFCCILFDSLKINQQVQIV